MHLLALLILAAGPVCERESIPFPTRAEVYAYNLTESDRDGCGGLFDSDGTKCATAGKPVIITGKPLIALTQLLRRRASYDLETQMKCFEPRHSVVFYYGSSILDTYDVCFSCHNVAPHGSLGSAECTTSSDRPNVERATLTPAAYDTIAALLKKAHVPGVTASRD